MSIENLLSTSQAAKYLGLSNQTVIAHTRAGKIPASYLARRWRYKQIDLVAFVDASRRSN
jgi:excisionase family DNA binding protein